MSSRKPGYVCGLILLGFLMSLPTTGWCLSLGMQAYLTKEIPIPIPGLRETLHHANRLANGMFWHDQLVDTCLYGHFGFSETMDWRIESTDPETGIRSNTVSTADISPSCNVMSFADRLWVIDYSSRETYEVVDGRLQPSVFVRPRGWPGDGQRILINREPAIIEKSPKGFSIWTISGGAWAESYEVLFPDVHRDWTFGSTEVNFQRVQQLWCLNQGDNLHALVSVDGCLLYREGLELRPVTATRESGQRQTASEIVPTEAPASATSASNTDESIAGWSLVRDSKQIAAEFPDALPEMFSGPPMLVEGQPVAVVAHQTKSGYMVGEFYRQNNDQWSRFTTQPFRFGTDRIKTAACVDGQRSYVIVSTPLGAADVFAVETGGLRLTEGSSLINTVTILQQFLTFFFYVPLMFLCFGIIQGIGAGVLMWFYTKPDYEFGNQTLKLASLGWRGFARLIDLVLIVGSTILLGHLLTLGFDWLSLAEALNLKVEHPTVHVALRVAFILSLWLTTILTLLLIVQARWGITPGKWLCRLRTVHSTLRPCGKPRSGNCLLRRLLRFPLVDTGNHQHRLDGSTTTIRRPCGRHNCRRVTIVKPTFQQRNNQTHTLLRTT